MGAVAEQRARNVAGQRSRRLPRDECEAWLAGLIVTDGCINRRWGYTKVTQKAAAGPILERVGERCGRTVRYETQRSNFGIGHKAHLQFANLPLYWKTEVPDFPFLSELERHYWRGVIDGDGCLTYNNSHRGFKHLEVRLAWNPYREQFLGEAWIAFLERLGVPFKVADDQLGHSIRKVRVRRYREAEALAQYLYEGAEFALPWKAERAACPVAVR